MSTSPQVWRWPLTFIAAAAVIAGAYWRFHGLGSAPFAVDEYYLARSIENLLHKGIPAYDCGGLYMRGIVLQYLAASLQLAGLSAEIAPRVISAISSLLALPAVFIIARRTHGLSVALLAVTTLALSVWEIELARFGRMYAPFQAVFLWYLVYFLKYTVDRNARALRPMLLLSVLGPLVWEGGVFLSLANVVSVFLRRLPGRLVRADWVPLVAYTLLLAIALWFVTTDFRGFNPHSWPVGYVRAMSAVSPDPLSTLKLTLSPLSGHLIWLAVLLVPATAIIFALRWIWGLRQRQWAAFGLVAILIAAALHQFLLVGSFALLLLLTRVISPRDLLNRQAASFHLAIGICALFWLALAFTQLPSNAIAGSGIGRRIAMLGYQFVRFPDLVGVVARPWARAAPHLAVALLLLSVLALWHAALHDVPDDQRFLLILFLVLLLAASAGHPPRQETRYVFFLYPLAVVIALGTVARLCGAIASSATAQARALVAGIAAVISLVGFSLSEDFQPDHLLHIDSHDETFRIHMTQDMQSHLIIRDDYRAVAQWLEGHRGGSHMVINGVHGLDHYYPEMNYFFVDEQDSNFPDWSCRRGTVERWGNYPLLSSFDSLNSTIAANPNAFLVVFSYNIDQIMLSLAAEHPHIAMIEGNVVVLRFQG